MYADNYHLLNDEEQEQYEQVKTVTDVEFKDLTDLFKTYYQKNNSLFLGNGELNIEGLEEAGFDYRAIDALTNSIDSGQTTLLELDKSIMENII